MATLFWVITGLLLLALFAWMWRYAGKIEDAAEEEKQWIQHIREVQKYDPQQAQYLWKEFEEKFLEK